MTGNEDSVECIEKGGELVKIKNRTTKIKLELLPEEETKIDKVKNKDLYFPKQPKKLPKFTIPQDINNYNKSITFNNSHAIQVPQTPGITYNLGDSSNNEINNEIINENNNENNNNKSDQLKVPQLEENSIKTQLSETTKTPEHPPLLDEYDDFVHKCKRDALRNSESIIENITTTPNTTKQIITKQTFIDKYKLPLIILSVVIILLIISIIVYHTYIDTN